MYEEALTLSAASAPAVAGAEAGGGGGGGGAAQQSLRVLRCAAQLRTALTEAQQACALRPSWLGLGLGLGCRRGPGLAWPGLAWPF